MRTTLLKRIGFLWALVFLTYTAAFAQGNFTGSFTENFTGFTGSGFQPSPSAGQLDSDTWRVTGLSDGVGTFGGTHTGGDFARGAVSTPQSSGGIYSFDVGGGNIGTLGVQPAGSDFTPGTMTLRLQNNTGSTLTELAITYDVFYLNDQGRASSFNFAYSSDDVTYTDVASLDFTSPAATDALGWQSVNRTTTLTGLNISNGGFIYLQWKGDDESGSGSRDEFALDNITVSLPTPITPVINEFVFNHTGTDTNEFIEIFGAANTDFSSYTLLVIEGDNSGTATGVIDRVFTLGTTNAGGYWTTGFLNNQFENGTQTILLVENFTGTLGDDLDTNDDGTLDTTPWTSIVDEIAVNDGGATDFTYGLTLNANFDGGSFTVGGASRIPNGTDTDIVGDWMRNDFDGEGFGGSFTGTPVVGEAINTHNAENQAYVVPTATITITGTLTAFTTTALNTPSTEQSYQVSGTSLTTDIVVTAPTHFQVSLTSGSGFGSSVIVPFATANTGNVTIFVRYNPTSGTSHSGNITNASTGATTQNVAVSGSIVGGPITIAAARALPVGSIVTISGTLTVGDEFGGPAFIQDATGGIAVFDAQVHGGTYAIGHQLTITARRSNFNNQIQLDNVTNIIDLGAGTPLTPLAITTADLEANRGRLVRLTNAAFPTPGDLIFGQSNYTVTDGSGSGTVRVDGDTDLVGFTQPASCDVVGVIGYFSSSNPTGFSQLLPRFQADIPCATPYVSPTGSTVTACIALDKTLEISSFNIEWFGDEGNSPAGANADVVQKNAVKDIIKAQNSDIYTLVEIVDMALINQLATELTAETSDTWAVLFSDFVSNPPANGTSQRVGYLYKSNIIDPVFSYAMLQSVHPSYNGGDASALVGYPDSDRSRFWASGRLPFWMRANVTLNGSTEEVDFIVVHARANSSSDAQLRYDMRRYDVTVLEDSLRNNSMLAGRKFFLTGDYNDDVDVTVASVPSTLTSYDAFTTRPAEYSIISEALSLAGRRSYVFQENMIDHITVSNELFASYVPNSVGVGYEFYSPTYTNTTSDHFMVSARFEIVPIASCSFTATASSSSTVDLLWADNSTIETTYVVEMSLDGTNWTAISGSPFAANSTSYTVTGLLGGTQYFFRVRAEETSSNFSEWVTTDVTTPAPAVVSVTSLSPVDNATNIAISTDLVMTFNTVVQAGSGNITVSNGTTPITFPIAGDANATVTIAGNQVTIDLTNNLSSGTNYHVLIDAGAIEAAGSGTDFAGFSTPTDWNFTTVSAPAGGGGGVIPTVGVPTNFLATAVSTSQINLSWTAAASATGYKLYRGNQLVATLGNVTSFEDTGLTENTRYTYSLVAMNGTVASTPVFASATTFPAAPALLSIVDACQGSSATVKVSSSGALYRVYVDQTVTTPLFETTNATITFQNMTETTTYYVSVVSAGQESERTAIVVGVKPIPTAVIATGNVISCEASTTLTAEAVEGATYTWSRDGIQLNSTTNTVEATVTGNYQVRVVLNGCSAISETVRVRLNYAPIAKILEGEQVNVCNTGVTLNAQEVANATYEWTSDNVVVGTTAQLTVNQSGTYILTVTENGCSATDQIDVTVTTIEENISVSSSATIVCPNEEFTLTIDNPQSDVTYQWFFNRTALRNVTGNSYTTTQAGIYYVQAQLNNCTANSATVRVARYDVPQAFISKTEESLSVRAENEATITNVTWFVKGEERPQFAGQTTISPSESGYYSAKLTYETGCEATTRVVFFNVPIITGEEEELAKETLVYPNPSASGKFTLQLSSKIASDVHISITDNIGRVIESIQITKQALGSSQVIDLSKYATGMYNLILSSDEGQVTKKLIIE